MLPITNISTYKFAELKDLKALRERLLSQCKTLRLKGTILLGTEGINLFVAGERTSIDSLVNELKSIPELADLTPKYSESDHQPFTRMLVKIKKEIIAFGVDEVKPFQRTSPKLPARELKKWLDEKKDFVLLDTRNDYEIKLGTFKNALPIGIDTFRDFPEGVAKLPQELKEKPIVMFCTGGIRCEKAGPYMELKGYKNIFQLDGGILKYFEEVGGSHYDGSCFVFDQRVGVDPTLLETNDKQCFVCLSPLTLKDQADSRYVQGKHCPYCFKTEEEKRTLQREEHQRQLMNLVTPLPGSKPYDQFRPFKIPSKFDGVRLIDFVSEVFKHVSKEQWEKDFKENRFLDREKNIVSAERIVKAGDYFLHLSPQRSEPDVNAKINIVYEDEAIIVVEKPSPLPVHPSGRYNRNTLQWMLNEIYYPLIPRPAHRLDANTSGLIVFAHSKHFAGLLQPQFSLGQVEKKYWARVHGHPKEDFFQCDLPIGKDPIAVGARDAAEDGLPALTQFKVLKRRSDGTTDLEVIPRTGRTNQIRLHLWKLGFPILGDPTYLPNGELGTVQTQVPGTKPLHLHAAFLSFKHPLTRQRVEFSSSPKHLSN